MENNKYKILVLSDLNESASTTLKSTVSLAKMIRGEIDVFCVKKPTDIIKNDNQLSSVRELSDEYKAVDKQVNELITPISKHYDINIDYKFAFGNIKHEIENYIKECKPDIVVLGKRKLKPLHFIGDHITEFVLKTFGGVIMIMSEENALEPNEALSLGALNDVDQAFNIDFASDLIEHTQKPLKSFKIIKDSNELKTAENRPKDNQVVEFIFEHSDNTLNNLSNYLSKNNINLLCVNRDNKTADAKGVIPTSNIKDVVNKLNVSLLLTGEQKYSLR